MSTGCHLCYVPFGKVPSDVSDYICLYFSKQHYTALVPKFKNCVGYEPSSNQFCGDW